MEYESRSSTNRTQRQKIGEVSDTRKKKRAVRRGKRGGDVKKDGRKNFGQEVRLARCQGRGGRGDSVVEGTSKGNGWKLWEQKQSGDKETPTGGRRICHEKVL